eukprot:1802155-Alexandrium_andersonii.AAC.1
MEAHLVGDGKHCAGTAEGVHHRVQMRQPELRPLQHLDAGVDPHAASRVPQAPWLLAPCQDVWHRRAQVEAL